MDQAAEALIVELASHRRRQAGETLTPTTEQETLGIPSQLVYIAGVTLSGKSVTPPFSSSLQERFTKLQELYNNNAQVGVDEHERLKSFHLSPRIAPTKEQQQLIDQDVSRTLRELETQADAVVQELLNSEEKQTKKSKTKKSKRSKAKNPLPAKRNVLEEDRAPVVPSETLEDVIMAIKIHSDRRAQGSSLDNDNDTAGSWISVKKKGSKTEPEPLQLIPKYSNEKENDTSFNNNQDTSSSRPVEKSPETNPMLLVDGGDFHDISTSNGSFGSYLSAVAQNPTKTSAPEIISLPRFESDGSTKMEEQRIIRLRQLEMQLVQKDQQLHENRMMHAKALREEKERCEDSMQDLQLRLYISETRLKTYQDSLEQHVESVASNLSNNFTPSSPMRRGGRGVAQDPPSSPLISRAF